MNRAEIKEKASKTIIEHLGVKPEEVTEEAKFEEDLRCDSLDLLELIMAFEEQFHVEVPDDEGEAVKTVADAIDLIEKKLNV